MPIKTIPLPSLDILKASIIYNPDTGELFRRKTGKPLATVSKHGYGVLRIDRTQYRSHRVAYMLATGEDPGEMEVDHIDGNKLNNRASNLRLATRRENQRNRGLSKVNATGVKGVTWNRETRRYVTRMRVGGRNMWFGSFPSLEEAGVAIRAAREQLHGDFANHGV
jgi:hypothetical protein